MNENKNIEYISIDKLHPHEDNPRRDVGDVTELAESIKKNGVLQNLTVVPATGYYHGDYTVIIGHRRLAAAKLAGLKELPCAVVEMDKKTQIATMLLENMQRSDLTVYEQAQGFQMMLDLGETVESVAEKTGFSQSTVRRRTKLLQLDADTFKATESRDITLEDYEKLFEIKDAKRRDKVLGEIGTNNFNNALETAKREEEREEINAAVKAALEEVGATERDEEYGLKYVGWTDTPEDVKRLCSGDYEYFYRFASYSSGVYIYRAYTDEEKRQRRESDDAVAEKAAAEAERRGQINEISERMFTLRKNFIRDCDTKGKEEIIAEYAARTILRADSSYVFSIEYNRITDALGMDGKVADDVWEDFLKEKYEAEPWKVLLAIVYGTTRDNKWLGYIGAAFAEKERLDFIYEMLERLGYEMSDEEKELRYGTHELFEEAGK